MKVVPFKNKYQPLIDEMLAEIQKEFDHPFTSASSKRMMDANKVRGTKFWVLMDDEVLAGTVGIIKMKNNSLALKSFFIPLKYRGSGAAKILLDTVIYFSKKKKIQTIYLGTMDQMKAAHRFYEKNGFVKTDEKDLPTDFP